MLVIATKAALSVEHVRLLVRDRKLCRAKGCEWESELGEDIVCSLREVCMERERSGIDTGCHVRDPSGKAGGGSQSRQVKRKQRDKTHSKASANKRDDTEDLKPLC